MRRGAGTLRGRLDRLQERRIARALAPWEGEMRRLARACGASYAYIRGELAAGAAFHFGQPADPCGCIAAEPLVRWLVARYDLDDGAEAELWASAHEAAKDHDAHSGRTSTV